MNDLGRILWLWRGQFAWLLLGLIVSLTTVAAGVGLMAIAGGVLGKALLVGGAILAPLALRWLGVWRVAGRYLERLLTHAATFRALADLRVWFFRGLARGAAGGLGFRQAGDVLARLVGDVEALDGLYLRILVPLFAAVLLLPALAVIIGSRAAWLGALVCLCFALSSFVLPWRAARGAVQAGGRLAETESGLRTSALDTLTGLREVRAFGAEGRMLAGVQARESALLAAQREVSGHTAWAGAGALLCGQAAVLGVLLSTGARPAGAVAAVFLTVAAFEAVGGLPRAGALAGRATAAARRVLEAAEAPPAVADPVRPAPAPASAALRFEGVRFRWLPDHPLVLDGLTMDVPEGARVALLGPSGTGKSTLAALALRLAAPEAGRVLLGGTDIADLAATDVRARIGWLSQATHLFDDTIRANLRIARPDADDDAMWAALDAAQIAETVRALPDKLDTWVGEGGTRFSGGQGRRLALARALLSPAPLLILDEPTAGLDADTERAFLATLNEAAANRTVLMIAHRLTGVERLDRIYRLTAGRAVAAAG
jgi:ATP-binding cassette subfamily C protein CydC